MGFLKRVFGGGQAASGGDREEPRGDGDDGGIFAGFFLARPTEVASWNLQGLTPSSWPAIEFKRLETVKLGTLEAILTNRDYDDVDQDQLHNITRTGGDEGPWVVEVREELVDALTTLNPTRAASAAAEWADTDEFKLSRSAQPRADEIAELGARLTEMADLARRREADAKMYLLVSL